MEAPLTDRLSLTNALADANIDRQKAERIATKETDRRIDRVVTRLGSLIVVLAGLLFAALHYWAAARLTGEKRRANPLGLPIRASQPIR